MANGHRLLTDAATTLRRSRLALAMAGAAIAGGAPAGDARARTRPPRLLWHVAAEGRGTPALDASTAYFLSKQHEAVAVNRRTGQIKWRGRTGEPGLTTAGSTVLVVGDVVVAGDYNVVAFNRADGRLQWRFVPRDGYGPGIYLGSSAQGSIVAGSPAGLVYAVDASSGRLRWSSVVSTHRETTVYPPVWDGGDVAAVYMQFQSPGAGGLVLIDAADGRIRWQARFPASTGPASRPAGGPIVTEDCVIAASGDGAIHGFDRQSGARRWTIPALAETGVGGWEPGAQDFRALARHGASLFAGSLSGLIAAYRVQTRAERWRRASVDASTAFGIAADADLVYVPHLSGDLVAFDARDGQERWRLPGSLGLRWAPAVDGDRLFLSGSTSGFLAFSR